jgi:hypothetical protein
VDTNRENLRLALWVAIAAQAAAVLPIWPYGLYTLLRLLTTSVALFAIYVLGTGDPKRTIGLAVVALLFNPIVPVHLSRLIWLPINLGVAFWFWRIIEESFPPRDRQDAGTPPGSPAV